MQSSGAMTTKRGTGLWQTLRGRRDRHVGLENVLGTSLDMRVTAQGDVVARRAEQVLLDEIDRLSAILSTYSTASELTGWLGTFECDAVVSAELAEVLALCEEWRVRTAGAFSAAAVAVAAAVGDDGIIDQEIVDAASRPLWVVDRQRSVARRLARLPISLDAVAKGYIVARATHTVAALPGVSDVLVNLGGDIQHLGDTPVVIGIADPRRDAENATPLAVVRVCNAAIATSGGYRRAVFDGGGRRSHLIDPRTGTRIDHVASASVIAPDCAIADILSTAFSVLEPEESLALAESIDGVGCLIVGSDGEMVSNGEWDDHALPERR